MSQVNSGLGHVGAEVPPKKHGQTHIHRTQDTGHRDNTDIHKHRHLTRTPQLTASTHGRKTKCTPTVLRCTSAHPQCSAAQAHIQSVALHKFSSLRLIAANDDCTSRTLASCAVVRVSAGSRIFVGGYDGDSGTASVRLSFSF